MRYLLCLVLFSLLSACISRYEVQTLSELDAPEARDRVLGMSPQLAQELLKREQTIPLLLEFSADWCAPCRQLKAPIHKLAESSQGRYRIAVVDVTSDTESIMKSFGMDAVLPGFLLRVPGSPQPLIKSGTEAFPGLNTWLLTQDHPTAVPLPFVRGTAPKAFKAMLVAGSAENANFVQELLWNYAWLQQRGFKGEEIGCFYGRPDVIQYAADREQFESLREFIAHCQPNNWQGIMESLRLSMQAHPRDFYLYLTSHGAAPVADKLKRAYRKRCLSFAPALILDQDDPSCESKRGLTPEDLAKAMQGAPDTHKFLVIQGCYTGGFISEKDNPKTAPSVLAQLPHIRILTASSAENPSFGCDPGSKSTFYGYAYMHEVAEIKEDFESMDWPKIYENVSQSIRKLEKDMRVGRKSNPRFYENP